jgi:hydroxymethylbilane synthase
VTAGDVDKQTPIFSLDQKGIFEKEIDQAVLDGQVDFAVHSMKDIPIFDENSNLLIASVPERGSPADVLVSKENSLLKNLRRGSKVGTSSLLRVAEIRRARDDLKPEPIRGNVETRIQKVDKGEFDAVVLAEAGIARLGIDNRITEKLPLDLFLPAPGQGALAIVTRKDNSRVIEVVKSIEHQGARAEIEAERETVRILEGGCKVPVGVLAQTSSTGIKIVAQIFSMDGKEAILAERSGLIEQALPLAREVGNDLVKRGAKKISETWRAIYA